MRRLRIATLVLLLGLPAAASADDSAWGTASSRPAAQPAAAQLGRPVVIAQTPPTVSPGGEAPAAQLERPRLLGSAGPFADPQVRPISYDPVYRGQAPDAKPLPSGQTPAVDAPVVSQNWQRTVPEPVGVAPPGVVVAPAPGGVAPDCCGGCGNSCGACGNSCGCGRFCGGLWSLFHDGLFGGCGSGCATGACCGANACDGGVCDGACGCGCGCPPGDHFYVSAEYLLWWTRGNILPPLIAQGSVGDLANHVPPGAIGVADSINLFGGADYNTAARSGGRVMAGWWFGDDHCLGIEGGGFVLGDSSTSFNETSFGSPVLARPFFDLTTGLPNSELISAPGLAAGTATGSVRNSFWGAEANLRSNLWCGPWATVDLIAGYRHLSLDDTLDVSETISGLGPFTGLAFAGSDHFATHNSFNGGQIGFDAETHFNRWYLDLKAKVALGNVSERLDISGATTSTFMGVPQAVPPSGALLTAGRVGSYRRNRFAWAPEVGLNLGYNLTDHWRVFVGYDFLFLSDVARVGDQVDLRVNPNLALAGAAVGPATPPVVIRGADYWAQGVNFGLEFRW